MKISPSCIQGVLALALSCFVLGFVFQVIFQSIPSEHAKNIDFQFNPGAVADLNSNSLAAPPVTPLLRQNKPSTDVASHIDQPPPPPPVQRAENHPTPGSDGYYHEAEVPQIVKAWRSALLDWHELLPKHNSIWERFGTPQKEGKLRLLVSKEVQITNYLTRFHESGLSSKYGFEYGKLEEYSGCNILASSCMIHRKDTCQRDQLCKWSVTKDLCVDGWEANQGEEYIVNTDALASCPNPQLMNDGGFQRAMNPSGECKIYVHQPALVVTADSEAQSMFYHWWAVWTMLVDYWKGELKGDRGTHFFMKEINDPMFYNFFGILGDNCWRRANAKLNEGACFCNTKSINLQQNRKNPVGGAETLIKYLELDQVQPPPARVKVGIISRRVKRFILNEYELVNKVLDMGYDCVLLPLEQMTMYEQMREFRSLDVLIGIHGSGLDNSVFMHKGSVLVQLLPYKSDHRCTFESSARGAGINYQEWQLTKRENTVLHWDLLMQSNSERLLHQTKEQYLQKGQISADMRDTLMFWINQDIIVPLDEWEKVVERAVKGSQAAVRGVDIAPKRMQTFS